MKFGQFVSCYKRKSFIKFYKKYDLKLVPGPFVFAKNKEQSEIGK